MLCGMNKKGRMILMIKLIDRKKNVIRVTIAVLLMISMIFANGTALSYADSGTSGTFGTSGTDAATIVLTSMGVISPDSSGSFNLSNTVTRAEFAKMIVMASAYKDLVQTASYSSPYKDVPATHWAAPYVRIAVSKGIMSGYSDGTFRPDGIITLEQGVNCALKLLGYSQSDFVGAFPYAQMNVFGSSGLSKNITGGVGTYMTRGDAANLIFNMMGTGMKDGSSTYAETLGYSLNASGEVNYAEMIDDNMSGPYTVKSSNWSGELGMSSSSLTVYKNGSVVTAADVELYDILYYSASRGTVWVYDDKVTGVYEKASPSQNAVTTVTVSGTEYQLESAAAFSALSSMGTLKIGSGITLLLGKNGGVADAISSTVVKESAIVYVTETGEKTYENANGAEYNSFYFKGVKPNGSEIEYAATQDWIEPGDLIEISFASDGKMSVTTANAGSKVTGVVDADLNLIGSASIAANATILDTGSGNYAATSLSRLNGIRIQADDVLYYEASGGKVTTLILNDVTGDTAKYGIVTSVKSNSASTSPSGSYEYMLEGITSTLTTSDRSLSVSVGPVKFIEENGKINNMHNLTTLSNKIKTFDGTQVVLINDDGTYPVSANVVVYERLATGGYGVSTLSDAIASFKSNELVKFYYDKAPAQGGCIRVIVIY